MSRKPFTLVAAAFLAVICLVHAARVALGVHVLVGRTEIPVWMSIPGALFTGVLAILLWREARRT